MLFLSILASFVLVAFGEPTTSPLLSLIASIVGFVPLFLALLDKSAKTRFWTGCLFFTSVQLVQLYWFASHPYSYIYALWAILSFLMGLQFGVLCLFVTRERLLTWRGVFLLPAIWTLMEWSRLFLLTGFTFNPIGMMVTGQIEVLQMASVVGIYGLSFLVMCLNALSTRVILERRGAVLMFLAFLVLPIIGGALHIWYHEKEAPLFRAIIVETRSLPEEIGQKNYVESAMSTWIEMIAALKPYQKGSYDLIMMPEIVVPFAAEAPVFELTKARALFDDTAVLEPVFYTKENIACVSSFAIAKEVANRWNTPLLIGLEGAEFSRARQKNIYFNSAYFVRPHATTSERYDKQLLLPMAEEIPVDWMKPLAEQYGLFDSFQKGVGPVLFKSGPHTIASSVCYEDTFSTVMRENAVKGATILTNLTNDGWYPNSKLGAYHFELARVRAVENGKPLLRSCNFGTSGAFDAFGRTAVAHSFEKMLFPVDAFVAEVSTNEFPTPYTWWGNSAIVIVCCGIIALQLRSRR